MKCKKIFKYKMIGIVVIFLIGTLWHNLYELSGKNIIIGMIAPVNESMWEHWKLGLYPILIYGAVEYKFVKDYAKNFLFSKFMTVIVLEIVCFGLTALYHAIFKDASDTINMIADISAYFIGIVAGQIVAYNIECKTRENPKLKYIAIFGIVIHIIIFIVFTFNPPKMEYFKDSTTGQYGIQE